MPSVITAGLVSFVAARRDAPTAAPQVVAVSRPALSTRSREIDLALTLPQPKLQTVAPDVPPMPPLDVAVAAMSAPRVWVTAPPAIDPPVEITFAAIAFPTAPPDVPAPPIGAIDIPAPSFALVSGAPTIELPAVVASVPTDVPRLPPDAAVAPLAVASASEVPQCVAETGFTLSANPKLPAVQPPPVDESPAAFGRRLAAAARSQTASLVIYNARYSRVAYPGGDVSPFYGVCTDVIVRAYRSLGIDLQIEVAEAGVGSGDRNIDHRRTEVMRKFLARAGESLTVSDTPDDFQAGDIVTYYRPQNKSSTAHIAIVSDVIGPSGQPMIVHNRGWGVQLEDALFVDKITGHYRYAGRKAVPAVAALSGAKGATPIKPASPSSVAEPVRFKPKTPGGSTVAKAGGTTRALP